MGKSTAAMPDIPDSWKDTPADTKAEVGEYYLPGVGKTYLHPEFADRVGDFIQRAQAQGVSLQFVSGYRDQAKQNTLHNAPTATTPAEYSLHSAGRGVDITKSNWKGMNAPTRAAVVKGAKDAGLSWGGDYSKPDERHFYSDPGTDRRQLIDNFSRGIAAFQGEIPDR
jgi:D-alanyl-D-alanine dipeptidase